MSLREELFQNPDLTFHTHVFYQKNLAKGMAFEKSYIHLREEENRIYTDDIVSRLPEIPYTHPLKNEWIIRKKSLQNLLRYLSRGNEPKRILELGCGNGWLSSNLADLPGTEVLGADLNETELLQAGTVFKRKQNLCFLYADIMTAPVQQKFDFIILASSLQYFMHVKVLLNRLQELLSRNGEIHIVDTPIYKKSEIASAQQRSADHFQQFGSSMHAFYYHHTLDSFDGYKVKIMYDPHAWTNKFVGLVSTYLPFYWIRITR